MITETKTEKQYQCTMCEVIQTMSQKVDFEIDESYGLTEKRCHNCNNAEFYSVSQL